MHASFGSSSWSITTIKPQQFTQVPCQPVFVRQRPCLERSQRSRFVTFAGNSKSKSAKETDTAPEGKGEQREQPANRTDGRITWTKLRVERQTHLPASREEAWQALQSLLPKREWKETSAVFASLEAIYR